MGRPVAEVYLSRVRPCHPLGMNVDLSRQQQISGNSRSLLFVLRSRLVHRFISSMGSNTAAELVYLHLT